LVEIGQSREILDRRRPPSELRIEFFAQKAQNCRVLGEGIKRPGQPSPDSFVAGQEDRHHLVVHLFVGHRSASIGVPRGEQQRDEVAGFADTLAVILDNLGYNPIDTPPRPPNAPIEWRWDPARDEIVEITLRHHRLESEPDERTHFLGVMGYVCVEHHFTEDTETEIHHLGHDINRPVRLPVPMLDHAEDRPADGGCALLDMLLSEDRLHRAAVTAPEIAIGRQQAVTEEQFEIIVETPAYVISMVVLQHVLNMLRMGECMGEERSKPITGNIAVFTLKFQ
jgi:hypothetical protein